jgi:hypothetical protein
MVELDFGTGGDCSGSDGRIGSYPNGCSIAATAAIAAASTAASAAAAAAAAAADGNDTGSCRGAAGSPDDGDFAQFCAIREDPWLKSF